MNPIDRVIAFSQVLLLGAWEVLGVFAFGWSPLVILAVWFAGLWTFNVLTAIAVRTFFKLTAPKPPVANNVISITEEDGVG